MSGVALLGTGLLGDAIGRRLLQQGVPLYVWNRSQGRSSALIDAGAPLGDTGSQSVSQSVSQTSCPLSAPKP